MSSAKCDQLLDTALELFYQHGIHATGISQIIAEAGVSRMTLYKHFRSKEELVRAVLERHDVRLREWLAAAIERHARAPEERLLAIFDAFAEQCRQADFRGCPFVKAAGEYPDLDDPIHQISKRHQEMVEAHVSGLAAQTGVAEPDVLAKQLCLLLQGAVVSAQVRGDLGAVLEARRAAETLVRAATA